MKIGFTAEQSGNLLQMEVQEDLPLCVITLKGSKDEDKLEEVDRVSFNTTRERDDYLLGAQSACEWLGAEVTKTDEE